MINRNSVVTGLLLIGALIFEGAPLCRYGESIAQIISLTPNGNQPVAQVPPIGVVLINQTRIPVKFQVFDEFESAFGVTIWRTQTMALDDVFTLRWQGCIRLLTGQPEHVVYYRLRASHRYAFVAGKHAILLHYNEANDADLVNPTSDDPECKLQ